MAAFEMIRKHLMECHIVLQTSKQPLDEISAFSYNIFNAIIEDTANLLADNVEFRDILLEKLRKGL